MTSTVELVERLRATRARTLERLAAVADAQMDLAPQVGERPVFVRGMFHRILSHQVEHTIHLVKVLRGLGVRQSEAQMLLARLQAAQGELEGLLIGLSDHQTERAPAEGEWSVEHVLRHMMETEESYLQRLAEALEKT